MLLTRAIATVAALVAGPAIAVGLGPLARSGVTDGPGKAFYLTLSNPYPHAETFEAIPLAQNEELLQDRVIVFPRLSRIRANGSRKLLVIVNNLQPGERYSFRVCAARPPQPQETVLARVCSQIVARRLPARG